MCMYGGISFCRKEHTHIQLYIPDWYPKKKKKKKKVIKQKTSNGKRKGVSLSQ